MTSTPKKRAVIVVPGLTREQRNGRRDALRDGLLHASVEAFEPPEDSEACDDMIARLRPKPLRGSRQGTQPTLDIIEAYWGDLIPEQSVQGPVKKFGWGLSLLRFWLFRLATLRALGEAGYLTFGLMISGLLLVLWYVSIAITLVQATDTSEDLLKPYLLTMELETAAYWLLSGFRQISEWPYWPLVVVLLPLLNIDRLVRNAALAKQYLENARPDRRDALGVQDRYRRRVAETFERVFSATTADGQPEYDDIVIVAHSFGSVVALDVLADWRHDEDMRRVKFVTLGSPIGVIRHWSSWIGASLDGLLSSKMIPEWQDIHSQNDWLCAPIPGQAEAYGPRSSLSVSFDAPFLRKATGATHMLYFGHPDLMRYLCTGDASNTVRVSSPSEPTKSASTAAPGDTATEPAAKPLAASANDAGSQPERPWTKGYQGYAGGLAPTTPATKAPEPEVAKPKAKIVVKPRSIPNPPPAPAPSATLLAKPKKDVFGQYLASNEEAGRNRDQHSMYASLSAKSAEDGDADSALDPKLKWPSD